MIFHMLPAAQWTAAPPDQPYVAESLHTEGFIHCTGEAEMLPTVANRFYRELPDPFLILCIDEAQLQAEVKWEGADGHRFPHIYGPLNREAVITVVPFPRSPAGLFLSPERQAGWPRDM